MGRLPEQGRGHRPALEAGRQAARERRREGAPGPAASALRAQTPCLGVPGPAPLLQHCAQQTCVRHTFLS